MEAEVGPSLVPLVDRTWFSVFIGGVVILSTLCIGLTVDGVDRGREALFLGLSQVFTVIFVVEMILRLRTHGRKYLTETLNVVDFVLVAMMVLDNWLLPLAGQSGALASLTALRILRIVRLVRLVRLLNLFKDLWVIVQSFVKSVRALSWVAAILVTCVYVVSLVATLILGDMEGARNLDDSPFNADEYIGSVWKSCITFFQIAVGKSGDSYNHIVRPLVGKAPAVLLLILGFTALVRFGVLNMVVGIICENTFDVAKAREDALRAEKAKDEQRLLLSLRDFFTQVDSDGSGELTRDELRIAFGTPAIFRAFQALKLPALEPDQLFALMDADDSGTVTFDEFIAGLAKLKQLPTGKDVLKISMQVRSQEANISDYCGRLDQFVRNANTFTGQMQTLFAQLQDYAEQCPDVVVQKRRQGHVVPHFSKQPPRGGRST